MKRLSLSRNKKSHPKKEDRQQQKISSFFGGGGANVFKTPEVVKNRDENRQADKDFIEGTPESSSDENTKKKRRLFKLKKRSSKLGLLVASTTSLIAGNLDKKATKVHSPPSSSGISSLCQDAEKAVKKRGLSPGSDDVENAAAPKQQKFEPPSKAHISTPTSINDSNR